jgi:hypothetical protein
MGQYYLVCNLDKQQYLHPHRFDDGLKLLEFGNATCGTMMGLAVLLADGNGRGGGDLRSNHPFVGSWAGDRIVVAGDYADTGRWLQGPELDRYQEACPEELRYWHENGYDGTTKPYPINLYRYAGTFYADISDQVLLALADDEFLREELTQRVKERRAGGYLADTLPLPPELEQRIFGEERPTRPVRRARR